MNNSAISLSGRVTNDAPAIQLLPSSPLSRWRSMHDHVDRLRVLAAETGDCFMTSTQSSLTEGDYVDWSPTGVPSFWYVSRVRGRRVRISWLGGWKGYAKDAATVVVDVGVLRKLSEMEVIAWSAH